MTEEAKRKRGGQPGRPSNNKGKRKPLAKQHVNVRLTPDTLAYIKATNSSLSAGIEQIVKEHQDMKNKYAVYNTITGSFEGPEFATRGAAQSWVQTQDDKFAESGEDWTEGQTLAVRNVADKDDEVV